VCILSQRCLEQNLSRCAEYEFEDIICQIDDAAMLTPSPRPWLSMGQHLGNRLARHLGLTRFNPGVKPMSVDRDYELFVMICQFPGDLLKLNAVKGWRRRCRKAVCWVAEVWVRQLRELRGALKLLSEFDLVVIPSYGSVGPVRQVIKTECAYVPPGIDAITFSPWPAFPARSIDVYSIGRKSPSVHESLLKLAREGRIFYLYDTIRKKETPYYRQHRDLVANIAKRSRYFIANAPKINKPEETGGQAEISYRFLEGAASGAVMLGEPGESDAFRIQFDWPDAVIKVPYSSTDITPVLADLDAQPERLARIRKTSMANCLRRHDWAYRWRAILDLVGMEPLPALLEREKRLGELAARMSNGAPLA